MATPPTVPAGWYADPSARHEHRYWDGTDWTAQVSDAGVMAVDRPAARPEPAEHPAEWPSASVHPAERSPAAGPPAAAPAPRKRRRWAVFVAAAVVVLALIAGLLIWAPWKSPALLRPTGLTAGPSTTSSVTFRWARPATGPPPDRYVILHDGQVAGSVPGTATSYRGTGLAPATAFRYRVAAERDGKRSAPSSVIAVTTATPPVSAARLQGPWTVSIKLTRGAAGLTGPPKWNETWQATPKCAAGPCDVRLAGGLNGFAFKTTLTRAGAVYRGKITGNVFPCGKGAKSFAIRSTVRIRLTVAAARVDNGAWTAGSWSGRMVVTAPYTASGDFFCPASRQVASLTGNP